MVYKAFSELLGGSTARRLQVGKENPYTEYVSSP